MLWFQQRQFGIYSRYCNNHPAAVDELRTLLKDKKYQHFFEVSKRHTAWRAIFQTRINALFHPNPKQVHP